jgi:host factor-I protein
MMQLKKSGLQDLLLAGMRRNRSHVTLFLMNGFQLRGQIHSFDPYVVLLLQADGKQHMVYKHAISTIVPERPIPLEDSNFTME